MPDEHPYGWLSLAPPLATVVLAVLSRRAILSLLVGLFVGALILTQGALVPSVVETCETHLWPSLTEPFKLRVFGFTLSMGAMIGVINRGGGMHGFVGLLAPLAKTRRRGQLAAWLAGLIVFFDDYTNTQMLGATMRSTFDRLKLSREKLAYIVDSTAAPVAGIAPISTWVAIEIGYINEGLEAAGPTLAGDQTAAGIFWMCIPYRFYIIQALLFVPLVALVGRDFGPMRRAERDALAGNGATPASEGQATTPTHWSGAAIPLLTTLAVVLSLIIITGRAACLGGDEPIELTAANVFGKANSALALFYGAVVGLLLAIGLSVWRRLLSLEQSADAAFAGVRAVLPALAILWFASAMSGMTKGDGDEPGPEPYSYSSTRLYTGDYLQSLLPVGEDGRVTPAVAAAMPTVVFLMASVVAFSTGTSFGTMGILLPVVTPVVLASVGPAAGDGASAPLMLASFGGVLSGAIFGDHCSPISDTTILSSQSSGCDHVAHVLTQLPYALTVAAVCVALGTAPLAFGVSVYLLLPLQLATLAALLWLLGKPTEPTSNS